MALAPVIQSPKAVYNAHVHTFCLHLCIFISTTCKTIHDRVIKLKVDCKAFAK